MNESVKKFLVAVVRGIGQVMFQGATWAGMLFLAGIGWGAMAMGRPEMLAGAVVGGMFSTAVGRWLYHDGDDGTEGFNGVLVGCALPLFLPAEWWMWFLLVAGSAFTPWLRSVLNRWPGRMGIPSLTLPFVLTTWCLLLLSRLIYDGAESSVPSVSELSGATIAAGWLKGVSEVFLIDSWGAGVLFVAALAVGSRQAAVWTLVGSAVGMWTAWMRGGDATAIADGLYGFNPALTSLALGAVFRRFSVDTVCIALTGAILTVFVQDIMAYLLSPLSLPVLTAPFCLTTMILVKFASSPKVEV